MCAHACYDPSCKHLPQLQGCQAGNVLPPLLPPLHLMLMLLLVLMQGRVLLLPIRGGEKASRLQRYITLGSINVESFGKASFAALVGHFAGRTLPLELFTATPDEIRQEFLAM